MKRTLRPTRIGALALGGLSLALAACGGTEEETDDAATGTVEAPAEEALTGIDEEPVEDPALAEPDEAEPAGGGATPAAVSEETANEAADSAADMAAEIEAAEAMLNDPEAAAEAARDELESE